MKIIQYAEGIYEFENFLSEEEVRALSLSVNGDGWKLSHPGNVTKNIMGEASGHILEISTRVMSLFHKAHSHTPINKIRRLTDMEYMKVHIDGGPADSKEIIVFGIAMYLNEDFDGGEIYYPDLDIKIKPKKGSMVIHDAKFLHEVLPVIFGSRYSITTFVFGDEHTSIKK